MRDTYSTKEASELTGASTQVIRAYTGVYTRYFSTDATPTPGTPRRFTAADLKVIAFVYQLAERQAITREQVLERLAAGELEQFEWQPPAEQQEPSAEPGAQGGSAALVPIERLQAAQALMLDAQQRERQAAEREQAARVEAAAQVATLQAEVQRLAGELGKAQGELAGFKSAQYRSPKWWRAIFGGRQSE